jgi:hypothetical protein
VDSQDTAKTGNARSRDLRDLQFDRLPGTLAEVQAIVSILGQDRCTLKTGPEAGESALAGMESPRILHFATHGFFLTDQQLDYIRGERPLLAFSLSAFPVPRVQADLKIYWYGPVWRWPARTRRYGHQASRTATAC